MAQPKRLLQIRDEDLKEIFALFSSVSLYEFKQIYDPKNELFFQKEDLDAEYELTEQRHDFAIDALRSVLYYLYYLHRHGYELRKQENVDDLTWVQKELFVQA